MKRTLLGACAAIIVFATAYSAPFLWEGGSMMLGRWSDATDRIGWTECAGPQKRSEAANSSNWITEEERCFDYVRYVLLPRYKAEHGNDLERCDEGEFRGRNGILALACRLETDEEKIARRAATEARHAAICAAEVERNDAEDLLCALRAAQSRK